MGIKTTPKIYLSDFVHRFSGKEERYGLARRVYKKGELLTVPGTINNTAHFIHSGMVHLSLVHISGNVKSLVFYGPNTLFPVGVVPHETPSDYIMEIRAVADTEVTSFPYTMLRRMCVDDGEFAAQIMEQSCEFIGYMFYQMLNTIYNPTQERVCDLLYLYLLNVAPENSVIPFSQSDLASLAGISRAQVERVLKRLRSHQVILTQRGSIQITDVGKFYALCSPDIRLFNPLAQGQG